MIFLHFLAILFLGGIFWRYVVNNPPEFKRSDYSLQYTKPVAPTLQNPVHDWNPLIPCCIVRENLQQPSHCASIHYWPYMLHLSPRVLPTLHWNVHSLGLTNAEHASYLHFVWTNKHMIMWFWYTCCVDYIMKGTFGQGRFTSATNTWSTTSRHAAQTIPLEFGPGTGEGHSIQNYIFRSQVIHGDMIRQGQ